MKTRILVIGLALVSTISFGQKKEIKKAERAVKSNEYSEALDYLAQAEPLLGSVDNSMKAQFYATRGQALLGSGSTTNFNNMKGAAEAFSQAISLDPKIETQLANSLNNLRASLINSAVADQNAEQYKQAAEKLYLSYTVSKEPSDLYFAANNAVNDKDYDSALKYYQMLLDMNYTGETEEFVATNKTTGEVESFDNENLRNIALKTGEFIKPEKRVTESRKGEILRNMTLIYVERGENEKAKSLMEVARAENPNDIYLMRVDADMSYNMGNKERYNELMEKIVASDPDNPELYYNLGISNDQLGNKELALEYYTKAIELKPEYEAALINIAALKLSGEDAIVEEMNSLGNSAAENKRYDELKNIREELYREALPFLQKAYAINPSNQNVVSYLMGIYGQLGEDAKFKEMKTKLEELEKQ